VYTRSFPLDLFRAGHGRHSCDGPALVIVENDHTGALSCRDLHISELLGNVL